jgi:hypothetical protein
MLCNDQYFYIVDKSHVAQQYTQRIVAFSLQQLLRERATVSRYAYIASVVKFYYPLITCTSRPVCFGVGRLGNGSELGA